MPSIFIKKIAIENYRSFGQRQIFDFPNEDYKRPIAILGYNNAGKSNLLNAIKYGLYESVMEVYVINWSFLLYHPFLTIMSCAIVTITRVFNRSNIIIYHIHNNFVFIIIAE